MEKKVKKAIVNGLTGIRILATFLIPILFTILSAPMFITLLGFIFFTDFLDGKLARHWGVSTIAGSLLDTSADKLLSFAILITLSTMYPIMIIPALLEGVVFATNVNDAKSGSNVQSSNLGKAKTFLMWTSVLALFITGMSQEYINILTNTNVNGFIRNIVNSIINNKKTIETIAKTVAIGSEAVVAVDYTKKAINNPSKEKDKIIDILKDKEKLQYLKQILLDEKYYQVTRNMNWKDKLDPTLEKKEEIKKLMLKYDNSTKK